MAGPIKTALVPVTGAPHDEFAVAVACDLVRPAKGLVRIVYVIEVSRQLPLDAEVPLEAARGERVLQDMERVAKSHKGKFEGEILQARALGPAIVEEAVAREADLVVVGTSYEEHFGTPTIGDTVPFLLKHCPCGVVVYREAARQIAEKD